MGRFWGNARPSKLSVTPQLPDRRGDQELSWQGDGADIIWRPRRVRNRDTEAQQADCLGKSDARMRSSPQAGTSPSRTLRLMLWASGGASQRATTSRSW